MPFPASAKHRLLACIPILTLVLLTMLVASAWLEDRQRSLRDAADQRLESATLRERALHELSVASLYLERYVASGRPGFIGEFDQRISASEEVLQEAEAIESSQQHEGTEAEAASLTEARLRLQSFRASSERVISLRRQGDLNGAIFLLATNGSELDRVSGLLIESAETEREEASGLVARADDWDSAAFWTLLSLLVAGSLLGGSLVAMVARSMLRSLHGVDRAANLISQGDLDATAPVDGPSELARLGRSVNQMARSLIEREARFRNVLNIAADPIIAVDEDRAITLFNAGATACFGYEADEMIGRPFDVLLPSRTSSDDTGAGSGPALPLVAGERREISARRKDGSEFPAEASISRLDSDGHTTYTVILRDISERKAFEERLEHQANHDQLTNLPNRASFMRRLEDLLRREKDEGRVAVLFLDLDRFKVVNDSLGHAAGDSLLVQVCERLTSRLEAGCRLYRFGGDEFLILQEAVQLPADAERVAEEVLEFLREPFTISDRTVFVTASIGIALSGPEEVRAEELLRRADIALYSAKQQGRDSYAQFGTSAHALEARILDLESDLRQALELEQFELHFQPLVRLSDLRVIGAEALIRWNHPEHGQIPPARFLPLAEELGMLFPIGEWVLCTAVAEAVHWKTLVGRDLVVSVNVAATSFRQREFAPLVRRTLEKIGLEPGHLQIEILEDTFLQNTLATENTIEALNELGVRLAVDDFGTGFSSLSYLERVTLDSLKIDQSFVAKLGRQSHNSAIVESVISLAHALGIDVVAEGVETEAHLESLRDAGCDSGQGFYFARPMPASAFAQLLTEGEILVPEGGLDRVA